MADRRPEVIFGIDFGTTGTAVACARVGEQQIEQIAQWPSIAEDGSESTVNEFKVPTRVAYDAHKKLIGWGYTATTRRFLQDLADSSQPQIPKFEIEKHLKMNFQSLPTSGDQVSPNSKDAARHVEDFLRALREYIEKYRSEHLRSWAPGEDWSKVAVRYVFSYPTTWQKDGETRRAFGQLIADAGYKPVPQGSPSAFLSLDEASAAIAYFQWGGSHRLVKNDCVLVADVGGGTSDIAMCTVDEAEDGRQGLAINKHDMGIYAGGILIDDDIRETLEPKLAKLFKGANAATGGDADRAAWIDTCLYDIELDRQYDNLKSRFGNHQTRKGNHTVLKKPQLRLQFPASDGMEAVSIVVDEQELFRESFNKQCSKIVHQIKELIAKSPDPGKAPQKVLLAGGLGACDFVRDYLSKHSAEFSPTMPRFLAMDNPRLAVSKGLVHNELRSIHGTGFWKCKAQASIGLMKDEVNSKVKTFMEFGGEYTVPYTTFITRRFTVDGDGILRSKLSLVVNWEEFIKGMSKEDWDRNWDVAAELDDTMRKLKKWKRDSWLGSGSEKVNIKLQVQLLHSAVRISVDGHTLVYKPIMWHSGKPIATSKPSKPLLKSRFDSSAFAWIAGAGVVAVKTGVMVALHFLNV